MSFLLSIPNNSAIQALFSHLPEEMLLNLPACLGSRWGPGPNDWDVNSSLAHAVAKEFNISLSEAEALIRKAFQPIKIPDHDDGWWKHVLDPRDIITLYEIMRSKLNSLSLTDQFYVWIIYNNVQRLLGHFHYATFLNFFQLPKNLMLVMEQKYVLLAILLFLAAFIFLQVFFVRDVLLLFVVMDLALSVFAVLFSLTGLFTGDLFGIAFFFILLTLAACETAVSLGFLVSFSRRHQLPGLTFNSLRYASL